MSQRIACKCGKVLNVGDEFAGKTVKCKCGEKHHVPQLPAASTAVQAGDAPVTAPVTASPAPAAPVPVESSVRYKAVVGVFLAGGVMALSCLGVSICVASWWIAADSKPTPNAPIAQLPVDDIKPPPIQPPDNPPINPAINPPVKDPIDPVKPPVVDPRIKNPPDSKPVQKPETKPAPPIGNANSGVTLRFRREDLNGGALQGVTTGTGNVMIPLEIAVAEDAPIPYQIRRLTTPETPRKRLQLGVTPPAYDDMGKLLDKLGDGYRYKGVSEDMLIDLPKLKEFDVVFLTCRYTFPVTLGAVPTEVVQDEKTKEAILKQKEMQLQQYVTTLELAAKIQKKKFNREQTLSMLRAQQKTQDQWALTQAKRGKGGEAVAAGVIRKFVEEGGILYASDLRYDQVLSAIPEARPPAKPGVGIAFFGRAVPIGQFDAQVVDAGLRQYLGREKIELHFNVGGWRPAEFDTTKVAILVRGSAQGAGGFGNQPAEVFPLLAKFYFGKGSVVFTSFHNAAQNSDIEKKLLEYLVFSIVNSQTEAKLKQIMLAANFTLQDLQVLSFSANKASVTKTHEHKGGSLQVGVGFEHLGAKLRLSLKSPSGKTIVHEEAGLYLIEVPNAPLGNWEYTVTPVSVPYDNFPLMLGVGRGK